MKNSDSSLFRCLAIVPERSHPFAEVDIEELRQLAGPVQSVPAEFLLDVPRIDHQLQELQRNTLTGRLRADEDRQMPKRQIRLGDLTDVR